MLDFAARAAKQHSNVIVFPELSLTRYPPRDLLDINLLGFRLNGNQCVPKPLPTCYSSVTETVLRLTACNWKFHRQARLLPPGKDCISLKRLYRHSVAMILPS